MRLDVAGTDLVLLVGSLKSVLAGSSDLLQAIKLLSGGWVALPGFLQELTSPLLRLKMKNPELHARLNYVKYAYTWMDRNFLQPE
mmetsp:Transcript_30555/g.46600  ORF Transcript_30555/g.46600 Transcript_30555/m.46600 type:complete len:85 (+) Transcript_30555:38-292(+)